MVVREVYSGAYNNNKNKKGHANMAVCCRQRFSRRKTSQFHFPN